jgi:hypothetical protein
MNSIILKNNLIAQIMKIFKITLVFILLCNSCASLQQNKKVNKIIVGYVFDSNDKQPLAGANITIKGSKMKGVQADFTGKFEIEAKENDILIIQMICFTSKKIKITTVNDYKIFLLTNCYTLKS